MTWGLPRELSWRFNEMPSGKGLAQCLTYGGYSLQCRCAVCLVTQSYQTLYDCMDCSPPGSSVHGDSQGKNTGVGCYALFQGIFPTQGSNPGLLHCRWIVYHLYHPWATREAQYISNAKQKIQWEAGAQYRETEWRVIRKTILQSKQVEASWG